MLEIAGGILLAVIFLFMLPILPGIIRGFFALMAAGAVIVYVAANVI